MLGRWEKSNNDYSPAIHRLLEIDCSPHESELELSDPTKREQMCDRA